MTTTLLLATVATAKGKPAACLPGGAGGDGTLLGRLARAAGAYGRVAVLTRPEWAGRVADALAGDAEHVTVYTASTAPAALRTLSDLRADDVGLTIAQGHLAADDAALTPLLDGHGPSVVLTPGSARPLRRAATDDGPDQPAGSDAVGQPGCAAIRTVRGRVVGASSPAHRLARPTGSTVGALHLAARDAPVVTDAVDELAGLLEDGTISLREGADDPGPATDLVALALVAAVRRGVQVGARATPRKGTAALVTSTADAMEAVRRIDRSDEEAVRLDDAVKRDDGWFTTFLVSSYSPIVVRWTDRVGLTPDAVTLLSMLIGVVAAIAFAAGTDAGLLTGAIALQAAFLFDCVDGQLARFQRRFTVRGAWLDAMFDRGKEYVVYGGLAIGGIQAGDDPSIWLLAAGALALQTVRHTLDLGYAAQQAADISRSVRRPLEDPGEDGPSFWEIGHAETPTGADGDSGPDGAGRPRVPLRRRVILALRRVDDVPGLRWVKRIVVLPIGERFALISLVAVLGGPRAVFVALLLWGGLATAYLAAGRIVRSML